MEDTLTGVTHEFFRATLAKAFVALMIGSDKPYADLVAEGEMDDLLEAIKGTRVEKYEKWFRLDETTLAPFDLEWVQERSVYHGQVFVEMDSCLHAPKN